MFTYEKLTGLSRDRVVDAIVAVLRAHDLSGIELIWLSENGGKVLRVTVENAASSCAVPVADSSVSSTLASDASVLGSPASSEGVTLELCTRVSREISAVLDEGELIPGQYYLEVGTPGLERSLYVPADYTRFAGKLVKVTLSTPIEHEYTLCGELCGLTNSGCVRLEVNGEERIVPFDTIRTGQLVIDWDSSGKSAPRSKGLSASRS